MRKFLSPLITCVLLLSFSTIIAVSVNNDDIQVRDELILDLLFPLMYKELEKRYGEPKQYEDDKILKINKKRDNYFDITVQVTTFEGAHNPPHDLVTITFSNYYSTSWQAIDFSKKRLKSNK